MAAAMAVAFSPHRLLPFISVMVSVTALKAHPSQAKRKRVSLLRPNISVYSDVVEMHLCAHTEVTGSIDTCTIEYEGLSVEVEISTEDSNTIKVEKPGEDKDGSFRQEITYRDSNEIQFSTYHYNEWPLEGRGAAISEATKKYDISKELAAKYPLSSLFEPVEAILEAGVTEETCSKVAEYIENNPCGPFKNEGRMPWLYQFMLDPGLDKYEGYK